MSFANLEKLVGKNIILEGTTLIQGPKGPVHTGASGKLISIDLHFLEIAMDNGGPTAYFPLQNIRAIYGVPSDLLPEKKPLFMGR
jgi:hypothetical protein